MAEISRIGRHIKMGDVVEFLHFTKVLSYDRSLLWLGRPD